MQINNKPTCLKSALALVFVLLINASYGQASIALSVTSKNNVSNSMIMGYAVSSKTSGGLWVPPPGTECVDDISANCSVIDFLIKVTTTSAGVTTNLFPSVDYAPVVLSRVVTPLVASTTPVNFTFDLCKIYTFTVGQTYTVQITYNTAIFNNSGAIVPSNVVTFTY